MNNRRIVIKIGTSTLAHETGRLNIRRVQKLCRVISDLKNAGNEIIIVSSGAIGLGVGKLALGERPSDIPTKQASAAVGQCEIMYTYDKLFAEYNYVVAQVLMTKEDFDDEKRYNNFKNTMNRLLSLGAIPVINENDTVATDEIVIGDNDTLSALVSVGVSADLLILLSDIDGLFDGDPRKCAGASLIPVIETIDDKIMALGGGSGSAMGTGGMETKLHAAKICTDNGCDMIIANGKDPDVLYDITDGKQVGSLFVGKKRK